MHSIIKNEKSETLDYTFSPAKGVAVHSDWIVVLGHGVTGNKDREVVVDLANALSESGFATLRFSFAGNGDSEGDFRDATINKEVRDLDAVIAEVFKTYSKICYIGHSMGGAVGVLKAAEDKRIDALVSLAGMVDTRAFAETEFGEETPDVGCMWEDEDCPLSAAFMKDLCETVGNVKPQVEAVSVPWLLLHGTADDVVLIKDTETVQQLRGSDVSVKVIKGADHSFSSPEHKAEMVKTVTEWLQDLVEG